MRLVWVNRTGCTRIVFMLPKVVIKIPTTLSWKLFLNGLLANLNERMFANISGKGFPTVYFADPLGFVVVAKRVAPVRHRGLFWVNLTELIVTSDLHKDFWESDLKPENFGYDVGMKLIKIDLG